MTSHFPVRCVVPLLLLGLAIGGLAACRRSHSAADQGIAEGRLLLGNGLEPSTLDPHVNTGSAESNIIGALWEPLVEWDETATKLVPAAAERWEISPDGLTYTFHLRRDARWSNGEPVTAADWVGSFRRFFTPTLGAELASRGYDIAGAEEFHRGRTADPATLGIMAPDTHTLVLRFRAPNAAFLGMLTAYPWLPVHLPSVAAAGGLARPGSDFIRPGKLIGNGPFRLAEWRQNQFVRLERNPHFRTAARAAELRFFALESIDTEERAYRTGQLHTTGSVPASKVAAYRAAADPALRQTRRIGTHFLSFNTRRAPFGDARVRRAFALAVDRRQIVDAVLKGGEQPGYALVGPVPGDYAPQAVLAESADEARRLLAAAGFPGGQGFPEVEYLYNTNERNRDVAEALQQMWLRTLGVRLTLRNEEWKVFLDTRRQGAYQLARAGWLPWTPEPLELYELAMSTAGTNETGWSNARYDALFAEARRTVDRTARHALYGEMDGILRDEMPVLPLAYYSVSRLVHPAVTGWHDNLLDTRRWAGVGFGAAP